MPNQGLFIQLWTKKGIRGKIASNMIVTFCVNGMFLEKNKTYVHSFGTSRSWTNLSQYESSNPSSSSTPSGGTIPRVTYRRLEKIASYHYLPRVVLYNNGTLKKSQSHQNFAAKDRKDSTNSQWEIPDFF